MMQNWVLQREPTKNDATFGQLYVDGYAICRTLEDTVREVPGVPVIEWKVPKQTAIPSGRYRLSFEDSPHFGPNTITINDVPGFELIRMHGGNKVTDTEGCVLVGKTLDRYAGTISGAKTAGVLEQCKNYLTKGLNDGEVWLEVKNA